MLEKCTPKTMCIDQTKQAHSLSALTDIWGLASTMVVLHHLKTIMQLGYTNQRYAHKCRVWIPVG